jgi:GNAT superfamily N-acetyltransferase
MRKGDYAGGCVAPTVYDKICRLNHHKEHMNQQQIRQIYDRYIRREAEFPNFTREELPGIVRLAPQGGVERGFIAYTQVEESNVDAAIEAQIAYFGELGVDFEWKLYDYDTPPDLKQRLARRCFEIGEDEAILFFDLGSLPEQLRLPGQAEVRRLEPGQSLDDILTIENEVWSTDHSRLVQRLKRTLDEQAELISIYVAYVGGEPAAAGWIEFYPGKPIAALWGGSTRAAFRGRGLYKALLARRAQEALQRGVLYLTVDASPMSRPILERLGFQLVAISNPCTWQSKHQNDPSHTNDGDKLA